MWKVAVNFKNSYGMDMIICDSMDDLSSIPMNLCVQGSTAFIIDTAQTFMFNGKKEWKNITSAQFSPSSPTDEFNLPSIVDGGFADG